MDGWAGWMIRPPLRLPWLSSGLVVRTTGKHAAAAVVKFNERTPELVGCGTLQRGTHPLGRL